MESQRNWYSILFSLGIVGTLQSLILLPVAIIMYTGGSVEYPNSPGFSLLHNFLSDLGRTIAYSGNPNPVSSFIFNISLFLTGVLLIPYFVAHPKLFQGTRESLWLSILGSIIGVMFALTFVGGSLTPSDLFMEIHLMFGALAFVLGLPIVVFHTFSILSSPTYPNRYAAVYVGLGVILCAYIYSMYQAGSEMSLVVTIGQKVVVVSILVCFLLQSIAGKNIVATADS
ncbi:MAG: hypothetical protein E4H14_15980 [Candidatus Thorarchaeota archaeon]|nr:MAG: hypothetical protein E4H14_15980 [Candidatus Thorarchaeota archaeon]